MSASSSPWPPPSARRAGAGDGRGRAAVPAAGATPPASAGRASARARSAAAPSRQRSGSDRYSGAPAAPGRYDDAFHDDFGGPGGPTGPGGPRGPRDGGEPPRRGRRPRWGRIGVVVAAVLVVLGLLGSAGAWLYVRGLDDDLARTDPFAELTGGRPAQAVNGALNIMLVGSDSRDPDAPVDQASKWRADTIIVMHIPSSQDRAYLVSIPRDLYVPIPDGANAECGSGNRGKINGAFAFGGLPLAVRTVECFTDVRIDHVMAIDFAGFKEVTDALGGVDLKVERDITSIHKPFRKFKKGVNHMNGAEALDWIRQRKQFPDGDFARMRHQQEFLRALMDKAASTGTLSNPAKLNAFLKSVTAAVTVDKGFSLVDMALQFRNLRGENLEFITNPHQGSQTINGESVVISDRQNALAMYQAMASDKMAEWASGRSPAPSDQ